MVIEHSSWYDVCEKGDKASCKLHSLANTVVTENVCVAACVCSSDGWD